MRQISFILIIILSSFDAFCFNEGKVKWMDYGIQYQSNIEDYQKYIGDTVVYFSESPENYMDRKFPGSYNILYVIHSIKANKRKVKFDLRQIGTDIKVQWSVYNGYNQNWNPSWENNFTISKESTVPLVLVNKVTIQKGKWIGNEYSHPNANFTFLCVNLKFDYDESSGIDNYPVPYLFFKNSATNDIVRMKLDYFNENYLWDGIFLGNYFVVNMEVTKPEPEDIELGIISTIEKDLNILYSYIDDYISILFDVREFDVKFNLSNRSKNTLKIIWDDAVFVDISGQSDRIIHEGTTLSKKNDPLSPTVLIANASIIDILVPSKCIYMSPILNEWEQLPILPNKRTKDSSASIMFMLPIKSNNIVYEYIFTFNLEWTYHHPELIKN